MSVTIRDVAHQLNLSITTVSRALDGYQDVAEETRREVVRTAREMGYVPNRAARQLRRQRADTIGYILPSSAPRFREPFYSELISGIGDEVAQKGYDLLVGSAPPDEMPEQDIYRRWVQGHKVDGLIINRVRQSDWRIRYLIEQNFPFMSLESAPEMEDYLQCAFVEVDGRSGLKQVVRHLVERGHRKIAYIGGPGNLKLEVDRLAGFYEGLAASGVALHPDYIIEGRLNSLGGYEEALQLLSLQDPPTAIACVNDLTAIGVLQAAHERGIEVGQ